MINAISKHSGQCVGGIKGEISRWKGGEISFSECRAACVRHIKELWQELGKPPLTEQRKKSIHYLHVGIRLYNSKRFEEALYAFKQALNMDPRYSRAHLYYGNAQYKLRNPEEAIASWEFAIRVEPDSDAATKARDKLATLRSKNQQALHDIKEHLRNA